MRFLLDVCYILLLVGLSPWLAYAAIRKGKYRDGWGPKFLGLVPPRTGNRPCIWLHAVSVGEVNLLQPLLAQLGQEHPLWECVISTTTRTGFALARKKYASYQVFYCPLDFSWAVRQAMRRIRPAALVLVELELWPNLIRAVRDQGAAVAVVNGRLSEKSFRGYRRIRPLVRRSLERIQLLAVQNETYAERFRELGAPAQAVHVTGSIKFDGAQTERDNPTTLRLRQLWQVPDDTFVFLAGSTQDPEERLALETFRELHQFDPTARLIVVPRHPERFEEVAQVLDQSGIAVATAQQTRREPGGGAGPDPAGRCGRRAGSLVGTGHGRLRWRQHGQPRRAKHDRTGRLRRGGQFWPEHRELSRRRPAIARTTGGRRGRESTRPDRVCVAMPTGSGLCPRPGPPRPATGPDSAGCHAPHRGLAFAPGGVARSDDDPGAT